MCNEQIPEYLKKPPLIGLCQTYFDSIGGTCVFKSESIYKDVYVIEYGNIIATNPKLKVGIDKLFNKEFIEDKKLMGRHIYGTYDMSDYIKIVVYNRDTMPDGSKFVDNEVYSKLLIPYTKPNAEELVIDFDESEYQKFVLKF